MNENTNQPAAQPPVPAAPQPAVPQAQTARPVPPSQRIRRPANRAGNTVAPAPVQPQAPQAAPATAQQTPTPQKPKVGAHAIHALLVEKKEHIARLIPAGVDVDVDNLINNAVRAVLRDRRLATCDPFTVLDSVMACAAVGLDFIDDQAFLIPHEKKVDDGQGNMVHAGWYCVCWLGYRGMTTVAWRAGFFLDCHAVRQNDEYEAYQGTDNVVFHRVKMGQRGETSGVYCVVRNLQGQTLRVATMDNEDLAQIKRNTDCWRTWPEEMSLKSLVRRVYKSLPKTNHQIALAAELDNRADRGEPVTDLVGREQPNTQLIPQGA